MEKLVEKILIISVVSVIRVLSKSDYYFWDNILSLPFLIKEKL